MRTCEIAALQIELAVRDIEYPVASLGAAIARLSERLSQLSANPAASAECSDAATLNALTRDVGQCVESLQFVDRLSQHLMHVRDLLLCGDTTRQDGRVWHQAIGRIRDRLSSEEQRSLFDLVLDGATDPVTQLQRPHSGVGVAGNIELF